MQSKLTYMYMLTSGGHENSTLNIFLQHTLRARLFKSRISDSRRACLANGFAREMIAQDCAKFASNSRVNIIPYAQPRTLKASRQLYCNVTE